jgi:coenzyme F420-0:L-glutamate ligase / coenzyme F420-1:gamma-L-glutamate ligase
VIEIFGIEGLPEIAPGDDLAVLIATAADLRDGDIVVVAQKVVSKAEGALAEVKPGEDRDSARRRLTRLEAARVVADTPSVLIVETAHGWVCANAGIDASNVPNGQLTMLPRNPDASAARLRTRLAALAGVQVAVIVADTFGRPWRLGQTDVAIGVAGLQPVRDERGGYDRQGVPLTVTQVAIADELAGAADLVRRKADGVPVVVVRGVDFEPDETAGAYLLVRPAGDDLFRHGCGWVTDALASREDPRHGTRHGPARPEDVARAVAAAEAIGGGLAAVVEKDGAFHVRALDQRPETFLATGAAAGALVAALLDLGYDARYRGVDRAGAVVEVLR